MSQKNKVIFKNETLECIIINVLSMYILNINTILNTLINIIIDNY